MGGVQAPGAMGLSLSSVSVEVMKTESGYDSTTSSRELMPLIRASKWGDALVCKLQLNKVVFFKKKKKPDTSHPLPFRRIQSVLPLVENSRPRPEDRRCSRSHHFIVGVIAGLAPRRAERSGGRSEGGFPPP